MQKDITGKCPPNLKNATMTNKAKEQQSLRTQTDESKTNSNASTKVTFNCTYVKAPHSQTWKQIKVGISTQIFIDGSISK